MTKVANYFSPKISLTWSILEARFWNESAQLCSISVCCPSLPVLWLSPPSKIVDAEFAFAYLKSWSPLFIISFHANKGERREICFFLLFSAEKEKKNKGVGEVKNYKWKLSYLEGGIFFSFHIWNECLKVIMDLSKKGEG